MSQEYEQQSRGQLAPFSEEGKTRGCTRVGTRGDLTLPQMPGTAQNHHV